MSVGSRLVRHLHQQKTADDGDSIWTNRHVQDGRTALLTGAASVILNDRSEGKAFPVLGGITALGGGAGYMDPEEIKKHPELASKYLEQMLAHGVANLGAAVGGKAIGNALYRGGIVNSEGTRALSAFGSGSLLSLLAGRLVRRTMEPKAAALASEDNLQGLRDLLGAGIAGASSGLRVGESNSALRNLLLAGGTVAPGAFATGPKDDSESAAGYALKRWLPQAALSAGSVLAGEQVGNALRRSGRVAHPGQALATGASTAATQLLGSKLLRYLQGPKTAALTLGERVLSHGVANLISPVAGSALIGGADALTSNGDVGQTALRGALGAGGGRILAQLLLGGTEYGPIGRWAGTTLGGALSTTQKQASYESICDALFGKTAFVGPMFRAGQAAFQGARQAGTGLMPALGKGVGAAVGPTARRIGAAGGGALTAYSMGSSLLNNSPVGR